MSAGPESGADGQVVSHSAEVTPNSGEAAAEEFPSCRFIETGLTFFPEFYVVCCRGGMKWKGIARFDSHSKLSLKNLLAVRQEMRAVNLGGVHPMCSHCGYLVTRRWPKEPEHLISLINFSHFYKCNLKCGYCYLQNAGPRLSEVGWHPSSPLKSISELIRDNVLSPDTNVLWGGGEPAVLSDFDEVFSLLADHGCRHTINSNCVKLSPRVLEALRQGSNIRLICSIDSGTRETFKKVKGIDAFDRVTENLAAYCNAAKNRDNVALKYIFLDRHNLGDRDVHGFLDIVSKNKISRCVCDVDAGRDARISDELLSAMATMIHELLSRDVTVAIHGPGVMNHVEARVRDRLKQMLAESFSHLPAGNTPAELISARLTHSVWPSFYQ